MVHVCMPGDVVGVVRGCVVDPTAHVETSDVVATLSAPTESSVAM